ncbi:MAG TPA: OAM dimerization domain-containing protein [Thermoanaerobaculia bacterium]|nr:OAM dimerization domain-containing protein [Thermoanaerobaculia bacterium]
MSAAGVDRRHVRAYGDKYNDGVVQVSFTLPLPHSPLATEAAKQFASRLGLSDPYVTLAEPIAPEFTFFIVYGRTAHEIDATAIAAAEATPAAMSRDDIDAAIRERFGRRLVVLGCALESDAHTVGIDAIFNPKGFAGDYGLERYAGLDARNLGAQMPVDRLVQLTRSSHADAILVSATVTQNEIHIQHLTDLVDMLEADGLRDSVVLVAGGARVDHALAKELGYDAGFGPGTKPSQVAAFLLEELSRHPRRGRER